MSTAAIRLAEPHDAEPLARLKLETFRATFVDGGFAIPYPPADLAAFEAASYAPDAVLRELSDPAHRSWVAEADGGMVGYAHVGPCKLPHPDVRADAGELYQLYVRDTAQGLGLGRDLLDIALAYLAEARPGPVWLGAWEGNIRAHAIYEARGFRRVGGYRFPVGAWFDDEHIFRRD